MMNLIFQLNFFSNKIKNNQNIFNQIHKKNNDFKSEIINNKKLLRENKIITSERNEIEEKMDDVNEFHFNKKILIINNKFNINENTSLLINDDLFKNKHLNINNLNFKCNVGLNDHEQISK